MPSAALIVHLIFCRRRDGHEERRYSRFPLMPRRLLGGDEAVTDRAVPVISRYKETVRQSVAHRDHDGWRAGSYRP